MPKEFGSKKTDKLVKSYERIENELQKTVRLLDSATTIDIKFYNRIRADINRQYEKFRKVALKWSKLAIPSSYDQNTIAQVKRIKKIKSIAIKLISAKIINNSRASKSSKNSLVTEFDSTMLARLNAGLNTLLRLTGLTQQINVQDSQIDKIVKKGEKAGKSTFIIQRQLQDRLMKQALDKKYVTLIDKNGKVEQWQTSKYASMLARTKLTESQSSSTVNTAVAYGSDLVQVSSHNTTTAQCIPFEGKIFSISGTDPDFPPLTESPPYHPNCLHTISVIFRQILEDRGIKKYSDFSLGKTFEHPTRKSFIPINDLEKRIKNDPTKDIKVSTLKKQVNEQFERVGLNG